MPLSSTEQAIYDWVKGSLPKWFTSEPRSEEELNAIAVAYGALQDWISHIFDMGLIQQANAGPPDWLNALAADLGTSRASGESNASLRDRLRSVQDAATPIAIMAAVQSLLTVDGVVDPAALVELRRDRAYFGTFTSDSGVGGTFELLTGDEVLFTPDAGFADRLPPQLTGRLDISGAGSAGNDGAFDLIRIGTNGVVYENAAAVAGVDAAANWTVVKRDITGNEIDGFTRAYLGRGYRMAATGHPAFVVILPFGTTAAAEDAVRDLLRQLKAAGVRSIVERRTSP